MKAPEPRARSAPFDAVVVGAGPAGASAALCMAQRGASVLLLERGATAGSKSMFGGMLPYCPAAERLVPGFWDEAPWERHVVRRSLSLIGEGTSTTMSFEADSFDSPPYAGVTVFRPLFDRWLAEQACKAGATLLTGVVARELLKDQADRVVGVVVDGPQGQIRAPVVIACDGVLSFLAEQAGLRRAFNTSQMALGVKALFHVGEREINRRFDLVRRQGTTWEFLGVTEGVRGGGFLYTQLETVSAGLVLHLDSLQSRGLAPYEILERFLARPLVAGLLRGARLVEYSAHLLPEGGVQMVPRLSRAGLMIAGDAAALCYTNGLIQEGMNLAMTSGLLAGETALEALGTNDTGGDSLASYDGRLKESFVLRDMATYGRAPEMMRNERLYSVYPTLVGQILQRMYASDGNPRPSVRAIARQELKGQGSLPRLARDLWEGVRAI